MKKKLKIHFSACICHIHISAVYISESIIFAIRVICVTNTMEKYKQFLFIQKF